MEIFGISLSPLFRETKGLFIFCLLFVDTAAFLAGFLLVMFFRLLGYRDKAHREILRDEIRFLIEKYIGENTLDRNSLIEKLKELPDADKATLFLEYSRMVSGRDHSLIIAVFREAGLGDWAVKSSASKKWWRRLWAVRMIGILEKNEAIKIISRGIRDKNPLICMIAVQTASQFPEKELIRELLDLLKNRRGMTRFIMKDTFIRLGAASTDLLMEFLVNAEDQNLIVLVIEVAGEMKDPAFVGPLMEFTTHEDSRIRSTAARALSSFPDERVIAVLTDALGDADEEVRAMAASSLGRIRDDTTIDKIVDTFPDPSWMVRLNCALALKRMGGKGNLTLAACKKHGDRLVAEMALHVESLPEYTINWSD